MATPLRLDLLWTREGRRRRRLAADVQRRSQGGASSPPPRRGRRARFDPDPHRALRDDRPSARGLLPPGLARRARAGRRAARRAAADPGLRASCAAAERAHCRRRRGPRADSRRPMRPVETTPRATEAGSGTVRLKRALIGRPRASSEMDDTLISKKLALPIFASDPLSSVAYATESGLVVLIAASATAASLIMPISIVIAVAARDRRRLLHARRCTPTRRAEAPTSSPRTTSDDSRASSRPRRSSSTTSSPSPSRSPRACSL